MQSGYRVGWLCQHLERSVQADVVEVIAWGREVGVVMQIASYVEQAKCCATPPSTVSKMCLLMPYPAGKSTYEKRHPC
jgi:hypothetical protein